MDSFFIFRTVLNFSDYMLKILKFKNRMSLMDLKIQKSKHQNLKNRKE